jgi:hypothetical protein
MASVAAGRIVLNDAVDVSPWMSERPIFVDDLPMTIGTVLCLRVRRFRWEPVASPAGLVAALGLRPDGLPVPVTPGVAAAKVAVLGSPISGLGQVAEHHFGGETVIGVAWRVRAVRDDVALFARNRAVGVACLEVILVSSHPGVLGARVLVHVDGWPRANEVVALTIAVTVAGRAARDVSLLRGLVLVAQFEAARAESECEEEDTARDGETHHFQMPPS